MAEYAGSVELISGITQKNNGTFPLVNAPDVQVDSSGRRLNDVIDQVEIDIENLKQIRSFEYMVSKTAGTTPEGVTWTDGSTTITGTLEASASTMNVIYLVKSTNGTSDIYDEYITINASGSTYSWELLGNTEVHLSDLNGIVKHTVVDPSGAVEPETLYISTKARFVTMDDGTTVEDAILRYNTLEEVNDAETERRKLIEEINGTTLAIGNATHSTIRIGGKTIHFNQDGTVTWS